MLGKQKGNLAKVGGPAGVIAAELLELGLKIKHDVDERRLRDAVEEAKQTLRGELDNRASSIVSQAVRDVEDTVSGALLEPAPAPEPLPVIELEDVHLVCWLAVTPG